MSTARHNHALLPYIFVQYATQAACLSVLCATAILCNPQQPVPIATVVTSLVIPHLYAVVTLTLHVKTWSPLHYSQHGELVVLSLEAAGKTSANLSIQQGQPGQARSIGIELTIGDLKASAHSISDFQHEP